MRIQSCLVAAVLSAGMAVPAAEAADSSMYSPVMAHNWSGPYLGLQAGGATVGYDTSAPAVASWSAAGAVAGAAAGYNWQSGRRVLGIEADIDWIGASGTLPAALPAGTSQTRWIGSIRGRLGYAVNDRVLLHGSAGFAALGNDIDVGVAPISNTHTGFVLGLGADWAVSDRVALGIEGRYYNFGAKTYNPTAESDLGMVLLKAIVSLGTPGNAGDFERRASR